MSDTIAVRSSHPEVVQGDQIRAARALLNWSTPFAAARCGVGINTINRFEKGHRAPGSAILETIVQVFEAHGIVFIDSEIGPGVIRNDKVVAASSTKALSHE